MATNAQQNQHVNAASQSQTNGSLEKQTSHMTNEERTAALHAAKFGYGPLAHIGTEDARAALLLLVEMAVGNTFGATALSSYGGFWIGTAIILTPGGFEIEDTVITAEGAGGFYNLFGLYLMGWFIFTTILLICTLKSTVAFFFLFFTLDLAFLMLGIAYLQHTGEGPQKSCLRAGGAFGILAAFAAWYNALAGIADDSNSFFIIPVVHFPWSAKGRAAKREKSGTNYQPS